MKKNKHALLKIIFIITILSFFIVSCSSSDITVEKKLFQFEQKLSTMIKTNDLVEFANAFLKADDITEDELTSIGQMSFIYEFTPAYIKKALNEKTAIYNRIFSSKEDSISSFLPTDGNYDVDINMLTLKGNYIANIKYGTIDNEQIYNIEFVLIYNKKQWKILTINFFEI